MDQSDDPAIMRGMSVVPKPTSKRESLIAAVAFSAFASFYLIDACVGGFRHPEVLLMCLALYAASGIALVRAFVPTVFDTALAKDHLWLRLLVALLSVTASVAAGFMGLLAAMNPMVQGVQAAGADLIVGRILFGGMSVFMFGFAAWTLIRAALMVSNRETDLH